MGPTVEMHSNVSVREIEKPLVETFSKWPHFDCSFSAGTLCLLIIHDKEANL